MENISNMPPTPKFCTKCGAPLADDVAFCTKCGTPVLPISSIKKPNSAPLKPMGETARKIIGIAAGALILLLIVVIIIAIIPSPQSALDNYLAVQNGDLSKVEALAPAEYWESAAKRENIFKSQAIDAEKTSCEIYIAKQKEIYGEYVVTGKIVDETDVDHATLQYIISGLLLSQKCGGVTQAKTLTVELHVEGTKKSTTTTWTCTVAKINGVWYLVRFTQIIDRPYASFIFRQPI